MRIIESRFLRGPNRHAPGSVLRLMTDFGALSRVSTKELTAGAAGQLLRIVPALAAQQGTNGVPERPERELEGAGMTIPWLVLRLAIALIGNSKKGVNFGRVSEVENGSGVEVLIPCEDREVGVRAWRIASLLVAVALPRTHATPVRRLPSRTLSELLGRFHAFAKPRRLDILTEALVAAAAARGIPWMRLSPSASLVQLGHGHHRRMLQGTTLDSTGHLAYMLGMNKEITARLLTTCGLPVPVGIEVSDADEAETAAKQLGYPVVVKPVHGMKGLNVFVGLSSAGDVRSAFEKAAGMGRVLVQRLVRGEDHRLLVVGGRLVAAAHRIPAQVIGDGERSVAQLVEALNSDPRRGSGYDTVLVWVTLDEEAQRLLRDAGLAPESVPAAGQTVRLRRTANLSTGGTAEDVTDSIHPDNRRMAEEAAQAIGLDVAGVDFITTDITRSYREVGSAILEVNPGPGLRPHWVSNPDRDVVGPILDLVFPAGQSGRVPIAVVTGSAGKTTTCRMVASILAAAGKTVGMSSTDGVYVGGTRIRTGDLAGGHVAQQLLQDRRVEAGVFEIARGGVLQHGFVLDDYDVGAVLNVQDEHVGVEEIGSIEEMARIKRIAVEHARQVAVLNADDRLCREMMAHTRAKRICLVSDCEPPEHAMALPGRNGYAVGVEGEGELRKIVLLDGGKRTVVIRVADIPATYGGLARPKVHNAVFAVAIAHGLGMTLPTIRRGLGKFRSDLAQSPGRLNRFDIHSFVVYADFIPGPVALVETVRFLDAIPAEGRRLLALTAPGNRTDAHIREMGRVCAGSFSRYFLYDWDQRRGRKAGEVPGLIREALLGAGVESDCISIVLDQREVIQAILRAALPGDLVLVNLPDIDEGTRQIVEFGADSKGPGGGDVPADGEADPDRRLSKKSRKTPGIPGKVEKLPGKPASAGRLCERPGHARRLRGRGFGSERYGAPDAGRRRHDRPRHRPDPAGAGRPRHP
jgi:cyanophycin synthetase